MPGMRRWVTAPEKVVAYKTSELCDFTPTHTNNLVLQSSGFLTVVFTYKKLSQFSVIYRFLYMPAIPLNLHMFLLHFSGFYLAS